MATNIIRATATTLVALLLATAAAQYSYQPFFEQPLTQGRAYGLELVLQRLLVVDAFDAPLDEDLIEQVEELLESDVLRFIGTLRTADAGLAEELLEALEEVEDLVEDGEDARTAVAEARRLTLLAYDLIIPAEVRKSPLFLAALIADLSLGEGGVAEGYEEAAEGELYEFTSGWAALQRVKDLWGEMAPYATAQQLADADEMLELLDAVYPQAEPPAAIVGSPEEAEAPVQRLVGILETVADAELFAGRDMLALSESLVQTIAPACRAYQLGNDEVALEGVFVVGEMYMRYLAGFLGFMAPEIHEEASEVISAFTGLEAEDDDEDDEDDEDEYDVVIDSRHACDELLEALEEAVEVLGG